MLRLYTPSAALGVASSGVLADVTRQQRVRQLTHEIILACTTASSPFSWLRLQGFERIVAALQGGISQDHTALSSSLDQTYSQVLEVVLSSLDRQLVLSQEHRAGGGGAHGTGTVQRGSQQREEAQQRHPKQQEGPTLPPGGLAPGHATPEEWAAAMRALQGVCIMHAKTRSMLATAQYLQLLTNRGCSCPPCAPAALDALLSVVATSGEAQALFVGNGGLDAVVRLARGRAAAPGARGTAGAAARGGGAAAAAVPREVQLRCLGFIHVLMVHILSKSVRAGLVHPNTQRSSQQLLGSELSPAAAEVLCRPSDTLLRERPARGGGGGGGAAAAASSGGASGSVGGQDGAAGSGGGGGAGGSTAGEPLGSGSEGGGGGGGIGGESASSSSELDAIALAALEAIIRNGRISTCAS